MKKNIQLSVMILLSVIPFLLSTIECNNYHVNGGPRNNAVISEYSGGRFGDNLLAFSNTLYFALQNEAQLRFIPFPLSENLMMDTILQKYSPLRDAYNYDIKTYLFPQNNNVLIDKTVNNHLFVVTYFPTSPLEYVEKPYLSFNVNWKDRTFKQTLHELISPKKPLHLILPPKNKLSVALHVRKSGGFDSQATVEAKDNYFRFMPDDFYVKELKKLSDINRNQPLYVFLFTDDQNPEVVVEHYKTALNIPTIEFDYRKKDNHHDTNVLEDFFSMMHFDVLIRPESNYSIMAEKLGFHSLVVSPSCPLPESKKPSIALVTISTPNRESFSDYSLNSFQSYAQRWGYDLYIHKKSLDESRSPEWSKIKAVYNLLQEKDYEWVVWIDDDIYITNPSIPLESFINKCPKEVTVILSTHKEFNQIPYDVNTGLFMVKNRAWSQQFLTQIWELGNNRFNTPGSLFEQSALSELLQSSEYQHAREIAKFPARTLQSFMTLILDNDCGDYGLWKPGDFSAHLAGANNFFRFLVMKQLETNTNIYPNLPRNSDELEALIGKDVVEKTSFEALKAMLLSFRLGTLQQSKFIQESLS